MTLKNRNRYYVECTETAPLFNSTWQKTWQLFDRERLSPQGACCAVALCVNKDVAFTLRNALNNWHNHDN